MTLAHHAAAFLGMAPSPQQLGFLFCILAAFALGWICKWIGYERRTARWKRRLWRGERLGVKR